MLTRTHPAPPAVKALSLRRLTLTDLRNYARLRLEVEPGAVVLSGPNGAGKTNLIEAISLLAPGRGLRGAPFAELARIGGPGGWAVAAEAAGPTGRVRLGTAWAAGDGEDETRSGRRVQVDGVPHRTSGVLGAHMRILWLTPAMDRLFAGPTADRRRFLDRLAIAFDPAHGTRVLGFERLMRERNRLLAETGWDRAWLAGLETQMAEAGIAIAAARLSALDALSALLAQRAGAPASELFPWAQLRIEGLAERMVAELPAVEAEDRYRRMLGDSRSADASAGRTLEGPHRSDLVVLHGPKGIEAKYCSTGEQKALLVGIVLAHARAIRAAPEGMTPVLLLDEVAAHLDRDRREGLFEELRALGAQAWLTGTDAVLFESFRDFAQCFRVGEGAVRPVGRKEGVMT